MRKLLLGSTAVAAAALFAPNGAMAQGNDPFGRGMGAAAASLRGLEVRVGGYFRGMYEYVDQSGVNNATNRLGKSDFSQEIEIHILATGKAANGLRYGVALEIENDIYRTPANVASGASGSGKNTIGFDEAWGFLAGPWGQIRYGEEDGAIQQLQSGHITGFGIGGLDSGDTNQQVVGGNYRPNFSFVNDLGDNTKLTYLSPQFFGFDAGATFAFNTGEGPLSGCDTIDTAGICDRVSAVAGGQSRRRNEIQAALRWRGSFGPVGAAATVGYITADSVGNTTGVSPRRVDMIWAGATATAYGFVVGGWYTGGTALPGYNPILRRGSTAATIDDRDMDAFMVGATYTIDAITVGGHFTTTWSAGSQTVAAGRRDRGWAVGGNYRIAPGLDLFAEYLNTNRKEVGVRFENADVAPRAPGGRANTDIVMAGFRVAF
ncbi:porin [Pararoseomonas sp. SCSIO 73927]|uniref:porin n=1 Tax=Pararoseomonas sp. SCSIO 73927 TaxID=3114537 RepID=UPI0030D4C170